MGTRKNRLIEAVLTSTHNLCFGAKIRKNVYTCKPQFYYTKVGCKGVFVTRTCFRDVYCLVTVLPMSSLYVYLDTCPIVNKCGIFCDRLSLSVLSHIFIDTKLVRF